MDRTDLLGAAIATAVTGVGIATGSNVLCEIALGIGIGRAANLCQAGWKDLSQRWSGEAGMLNGDLAAALGRALHATLEPESLAREYRATPHYRQLFVEDPEAAELSHEALELLDEDLTSFFAAPHETLGKIVTRPDLKPEILLYGDPVQAQRALDSRVAEYLLGDDPYLIAFVQDRLRLESLAFHFAEELKAPAPEGTRAWRAFQRLLLESLQTGLQDVQQNVVELQKDVAEVTKATEWLKDWAERLDATPPTAVEGTGMAALLAMAVRLSQEHADLADDHDLILQEINDLRLLLATSSAVQAAPGPGDPDPLSKRIFLCYKRHAQPDQTLATVLHGALAAEGHDVFIDASLRSGEAWLDEIDEQIGRSDFLVVLLSKESADSEMVRAEVRRAYAYRKAQGHPRTLPVRIAHDGLLPYSIEAFVDTLQYVTWRSEADSERVSRDLLAAIQGRLENREPLQAPQDTGQVTVTDDGRMVTADSDPQPPLHEFDPRFLEELEAPGGAVKLTDQFYVRRRADQRLEHEILMPGTTTTIRAARQTGKSSLLARGLYHARQHGARIVHLDLQRVDRDNLQTLEGFLFYLSDFVVRRLRMDLARVSDFWQGGLVPQDSLTYLLEDYVLKEGDDLIVLALDEADRLLSTDYYQDFFALVRSWHNSRAYDERWYRINLALVISTEPYLLIRDMDQSPFNVGLKLYLEDFDRDQVQALNGRHGSPVGDHDLPRMMALLGGHPYLTRKALYTLVTEGWTWTELARRGSGDQGPFADHLRNHHWRLHQEPDLRKAMREIIQYDRCTDEVTFYRLLRAGLVKGSGDVCRCRCDLYRIYFKDKL